MKKVIIMLLAICTMFLMPQNVSANNIQLNEIMGAERFLDSYNVFCEKNYFQQAKITYSEEGTAKNGEFAGVKYYKFYYGYGANGGDGLGHVYTNAAGYISSIQLFMRPGLMTSSQAMMAVLALVSGQGYPPVKAVSDVFNYERAEFYSGDTNRYYTVYRDRDWEFVFDGDTSWKAYRIIAHD